MEWENQLIQELQWSNKISNKASKELVAQEIAGLAKDGDVIGAGSGSTVYLTLPRYGRSHVPQTAFLQ